MNTGWLVNSSKLKLSLWNIKNKEYTPGLAWPVRRNSISLISNKVRKSLVLACTFSMFPSPLLLFQIVLLVTNHVWYLEVNQAALVEVVIGSPDILRLEVWPPVSRAQDPNTDWSHSLATKYPISLLLIMFSDFKEDRRWIHSIFWPDKTFYEVFSV